MQRYRPLEDIAARNGSYGSINWGATINAIDAHLHSIRATLPPGVSTKLDPLEITTDVYADQNVNGIEEVIVNNSGFFGKIKNRAGNVVSHGLGYASNITGKIFSVMPTPVKRYGLISVLVSLLYLGAACSSQATPTPSPPTNTPAPTALPTVNLASTRIAFSDYGRESTDIYVINGDGSNKTQLTFARCADLNPVWSPNGKKIAFESYRHGNSDIYVMNADGSNQIRLTSGSADDLSPTWSPNSDKIAYERHVDDDRSIYVMNTDGSNKVHLASGKSPAWSPVGDVTAYVSYEGGEVRIAVINADGSNKVHLASGYLPPAWSPDGKRIAFVSREVWAYSEEAWERSNTPNVYVVDPALPLQQKDPSNPKALTHYSSNPTKVISDLSWSPDSNYVAFTRSRDTFERISTYRGIPYGFTHTDFAVWVIPTDGSNHQGTTITDSYKYGPTAVWSPHGSTIMIIKQWYDVDMVAYAGTKTKREGLPHLAIGSSPVWSPVLYPEHATQGIEAVVEQDQLPEYISSNPQAREAYIQTSHVLKSTKLTREDKQKELRVLQNTFGEELITKVMRHIPIYDDISGEFVSFDAYMRSMANDYGEFTGAPIEKDPVGAAMRIFFDTSPETIKAMMGIDTEKRQIESSAKFECKKN